MTAFKVESRRVKGLVILVILLASTGIVSGYAATSQSQTVPLEVKEPLEIQMSSQSLSCYPGETMPITVTVENHASVSYEASLTFNLNDTNYQTQFVTFSNTIYELQPGTNSLDAWVNVSSIAPASELELTINITRNTQPSPTPTPPHTPTSLNPSMTLLAAGAKWAANNGTSVLYINWYDNYVTHHLVDPSWGPWWREGQLPEIKNVTVNALEQEGFKVTCAGDVPSDLSSYSLVIFEAWYAVEPKDSQLVRDYLSNGGNVVIIGGVPCYFSTYSKDLWPYTTGGNNLKSIVDWFGSSEFVNSGGSANLIVNEPFGTTLENQSLVYHIDAYGCYALTSMSSGSQVIARWADGSVYSFTHMFGNGRVYYQAEMDW